MPTPVPTPNHAPGEEARRHLVKALLGPDVRLAVAGDDGHLDRALLTRRFRLPGEGAAQQARLPVLVRSHLDGSDHALETVLVEFAGNHGLLHQGHGCAGDPFPSLAVGSPGSQLGGGAPKKKGIDARLSGDLLQLGQRKPAGDSGSHRVLALEFRGSLQELPDLFLVVEARKVAGISHG